MTVVFLQANPEAAQFQFKELQSIDKLVIIFDGTVDSGEMEHVTCGKRQNCISVTSVKEEENDYPYDTTALSRVDKIQCRNGRTIVSEQSMSISSPLKAKATWAPPVHKDFVDLCLEETLKGNKPGIHFTKEGWNNIIASFRDRTGLRYDRIQLKNHWDSTKEQWKIWHKLVGTSSMKWDPDRNQFGAGEEAWENYLKVCCMT